MTRENKAKVFKSGNSMALRIPKSWGLAPGNEFDVVPLADGGFELRRIAAAGTALVDLYGSFAPDFMADGRMPLDDSARDWRGTEALGKAG